MIQIKEKNIFSGKQAFRFWVKKADFINPTVVKRGQPAEQESNPVTFTSCTGG